MNFLTPHPNALLKSHLADGATIRVRRHGNKPEVGIEGIAVSDSGRLFQIEQAEAVVAGLVRKHLRSKGLMA